MRRSKDASEGVFVVLEGIDGSGTTTQAERFAAHMRGRRRLCHVTREPSGGPIGSQIRLVLTQRIALPSTNQAEIMALLFAADRLDHVESEIAPHLRDGYVVISDRYDLSSLAYQSITSTSESRDSLLPEPTSGPVSLSRLPGAMLAWIRELNRFARRPDVTVVLDVTADTAEERRRKRGGAAELFDDADLQARLAGAYLRAEDLVPGDRVIHVDGNRDPDAIAADIARALEPFVSSRPAIG